MSMMDSSSYAPQDIHVLYVDDDSANEAIIKEKFAYYSCKVTIVNLASTALAMLSKGKHQFDLVVENIHSPDSYGFILLQDATKMDLPVILLTKEDDHALMTRGIREGALFCIKKPVTLELIKYLWQHVLREKMRKSEENERVKGLMRPDECSNYGTYNKVEQKAASAKKMGTERNSNNCGLQNNVVIQPEMNYCIEWSENLHEIFMHAVRQLGQGRCYPKDILQLMNVPGLTRLHVASHLQKCRTGDWNLHNKRKHDANLEPKETNQQVHISPTKSRRFGAMPSLAISPESEPNGQEYCARNSKVLKDNMKMADNSQVQNNEHIHSQGSRIKDDSQAEVGRESFGTTTVDAHKAYAAMKSSLRGECSQVHLNHESDRSQGHQSGASINTSKNK